MPDDRYQHTAGVSAQKGSQAVVGSVGGNVYFGNHRDTQQTSEQDVKACRDALFLSDPCVDRQELISAKGFIVEGTCVWIRSNKSYKAWKNGDISLLWIAGGPGQGKTMLSIFLTEELERKASRKRAIQVVYYFCVHKKRDTGIGLLRGLIWQIIIKRPTLIKHVLPHFETAARAQQTLSSLESLWVIFQKLIADPDLGTMFCVLDGLDECDEATLDVLLPRLFHQLGPGKSDSTAQTMFRVVVVSRDIDGLQGCTKVNLGIGDDARGLHDIECFIHAKVKELFSKKGFDNSVRPAVQQFLLDRAEGTFLWVGFVLQELRRLRTCTQLLPMLDSLPGDLGNMYGRMLLQIPPEHRKTSSLILRWVSFAQRPLKLQELAAAVNLKPVSGLISLKQTALDAITLCGPILDVKGKQVTLVHQSARDYLLSEKCDKDHALEQFNFGSKRSHPSASTYEKDHVRKTPLLQYAAEHWIEHVKGCSDTASKLFKGSYLFFGEESDLRANWWHSYKQLKSDYNGDFTPSILHMMSYFGVLPWIEMLLSRRRELDVKQFVNEKDEFGRTSLHWAAGEGNDKAVQLLLDQGAEIDAEDNIDGTALQVALKSRKLATMQLLVQRGANINATDIGDTFWLGDAINRGDIAMIEFLKEQGLYTDLRDCGGNSPLLTAVLKGNRKLVELLIDSGADVNDERSGFPVLMLAVFSKKLAIVELLLNSGANIEIKDSNGGTPLHKVAESGNHAIVQILIAKGANIWAKDDLSRTVLHAAAGSGSKEVVQLFLRIGLDAGAKDCNKETMLHAAAGSGNEEVVQLFLGMGLDPRTRDRKGMTALHKLAERPYRPDNSNTARLLISQGADVMARDSGHRTALHLAAAADNLKVSQLLIDLKADLNARDKRGKSALDYARECLTKSRGNCEVERLLIGSGADVIPSTR